MRQTVRKTVGVYEAPARPKWSRGALVAAAVAGAAAVGAAVMAFGHYFT